MVVDLFEYKSVRFNNTYAKMLKSRLITRPFQYLVDLTELTRHKHYLQNIHKGNKNGYKKIKRENY